MQSEHTHWVEPGTIPPNLSQPHQTREITPYNHIVHLFNKYLLGTFYEPDMSINLFVFYNSWMRSEIRNQEPSRNNLSNQRERLIKILGSPWKWCKKSTKNMPRTHKGKKSIMPKEFEDGFMKDTYVFCSWRMNMVLAGGVVDGSVDGSKDLSAKGKTE